MNKTEKMVERFREMRLIPVVKIEDANDAEALAGALCEGGLPCAEVTFRTGEAAEAIRLMREKYPQMLVGAGTVLKTEQVDAAIEAGAEFIVSPGLNPKIVAYCQEKEIPVIPGVATASEIEMAMELGLTAVKFFPAEVNGGLTAIKALAAPYTEMQFMPTGGVNPGNVKDYLSFDRIFACGGTWMIPAELMKKKEFDKIRELTREAAELVKG